MECFLGLTNRFGVPWKVDGTPWDFGHELLQPNLEHIADRLETRFLREFQLLAIPALKMRSTDHLLSAQMVAQ